MKKLSVLQLISSSATSGAERHVIDLSCRLIERGHRVLIVCPEEGWLPSKALQLDIPVQIVPMKGKSLSQAILNISTLAKKMEVDVMHTHLTRAAYIGYVLGSFRISPIVTSVHIANNSRIYNRLAKRTNRIVAVSDFVHGMLHGRGIKSDFIDTVYNGTDFLNYPPIDADEVRAEFCIPRDRKIIAQVGRISSLKGQKSAIDALQYLRKRGHDVHGLFVGEAEEGYDRELKQAIRDYKLDPYVTFTGVRDDVPRLLDGSDIVAITSIMETFGIVAIEAMARSRAVVATRVGALPEVISDGFSGMLYDPGSRQCLDHFEYLLSQPLVREEMGRNGKSLVEERFSNEKMADRMLDVYRKASMTLASCPVLLPNG